KGLLKEPELAEALSRQATQPSKIGGLDTTKLIGEKTSDEKLLSLAGDDARLIWSGWTIDAVEYTLLANWLTFFGLLAAFVGLFVLLQQHKSAREPVKKVEGDGRKKRDKRPRSRRGGGATKPEPARPESPEADSPDLSP